MPLNRSKRSLLEPSDNHTDKDSLVEDAGQIVRKRDWSSESSLEDVTKAIFLSCAKDGLNTVLVSDLIEYIQPFMSQNESELLELRQALDVNNINPYINSETFYAVMDVWVNGVKREHEYNCDIGGDDVFPFAQFSTNVMYTESQDSNLLNMACSSPEFDNSAEVINAAVYKEQIKELQHQNRKLVEDLEHVELQLTTSEEQVEALQLNKETLSKQLILEQQANEELRKTVKDKENTLDLSVTALAQIKKLEKQLVASENEISFLEQTVFKLEEENKNIQNGKEKIVKRESNAKKQINELKSEILDKEQVISVLEKVTEELKSEIFEQKNWRDHYETTIASLKFEKKNIEAKFQEHILSSKIFSSLSHSEIDKTDESSNIQLSGNMNLSGDEVFLNFQDINCSVYEPLNVELAQANGDCLESIIQLKSMNRAYKSEIQDLKKALDSVKSQLKNSQHKLRDRVNNLCCVSSIKTNPSLHYKMETLESDNNIKYMKIVDLVEQLNEERDIHIAELAKVRILVSALEIDKYNLKQELEEKQEQLDNTIQKLQTKKHDYEPPESKPVQDCDLEKRDICNHGDLISQNSNLTIELNRLHFAVETLESDNDTKYMKIVDLVGQLNEERDIHKEELGKVRVLVTALEIDKYNLKTDLKEKQEHLDNTIEALEIMKHNYETLEDKPVQDCNSQTRDFCNHGDLTLQNSKLTKELNSVYNHLTKFKMENAYFKQTIRKLHEENENMISDILCNHQDQEKMKLQLYKLTEILERKSESEEFREENQIQQVEGKQFEGLINETEYQNEVKLLMKDISELKVINTNLCKDILERDNEITNLRDTINMLNNKLELIFVENDKMLDKSEENEKEIEYLNKENINLQEQFDDSRTENDLLSKETIDLYNVNKQLVIKNEENINIQKKLIDLQEKYEFLINKYEVKDKLVLEIQQHNDETEYKEVTSSTERVNLEVHKNKELKVCQLNECPINQELLICKQCEVLEDKIQEAHRRIIELDNQISNLEFDKRNYQIVSYKKLQLQIEKLQKKIEYYEHKLKLKQSEIDNVQLANSKLQKCIEHNSKLWKKEKEELLQSQVLLEEKCQALMKDFQKFQLESRNNLKMHVTEKKNLFAKKSVICTKFNKLQDEHQKLQIQLNDVSKDKISAKKESLSLRQKLKSFTKLHENCLKLSKTEIAELKREIEVVTSEKDVLGNMFEQIAQNMKIECDKKLREKDNLETCLQDLEKLRQENATWKSDTEEANMQFINSTKNLEHNLDLICKENVLLKENISKLKSEKSNLENCVIKRDQELKECEMEMNSVKIKLCTSEDSLQSITNYIKNIKEVLNEFRKCLSESLVDAVRVGRLQLENKVHYEVNVEADDESGHEILTQVVPGYLDAEILGLKHRVEIVGLLFHTVINEFSLNNSPANSSEHHNQFSFDNLELEDHHSSSNPLSNHQFDENECEDVSRDIPSSIGDVNNVELINAAKKTECNLTKFNGFGIPKRFKPIKTLFHAFFWFGLIMFITVMLIITRHVVYLESGTELELFNGFDFHYLIKPYSKRHYKQN